MKCMENDFLDLVEVSSKLIKLEDRSFRIDGIPKTTNETWDLCERKILNIIINKLSIEVPVEFNGFTEWDVSSKTDCIPALLFAEKIDIVVRIGFPV